MPADIAVASEGGKETVYVADTFSLRRVDGASGKVDEVVRTHGDIHEYPLGVSLGAKNATMTSWFSGTAHVVERATGKTVRLVKDLKAPMDAIEHADGSLLVL
ncbi:MAG TPA: hypothetical protein PLV68_20510, partial [Ilumatobacteraceae bacterium]|nr:hypothetical protein [Ilumatobacteraceae bacterium]